ncbi:MAG TPA: hypothetical protein VFQ61_38740, partial [Polyangiaceae bacterium]|nr:hypothetical protein [Polyangiaceae bacterium]
MKRLLASWIEFWDRKEAPDSLVLSRILVGAVILVDLLAARWVGVVPDLWAPPPEGLGIGMLQSPAPWTVQWFGASTQTALFMWWLGVVMAACFMLGAALLPAGVLLAFTLAELARFTPSGDRGIDTLLRTAALILSLSGANARWSLDAWIRARFGRAPRERVPAWPRYLLFLQLIWLYSSAAHNRGDISWWPQGGFTALGLVLSDPHYARFAPGWAGNIDGLLRAATAITMLFEGGSPLLIFLTWCDRGEGRGGRVGSWIRKWRVR